MSQDRRKFLQGAGLLTLGAGTAGFAFSPTKKLAEMILRQSIRDAFATSQVNTYVSMALFAAPSRWAFDQVMTAKDGENVNYNPMVATNLIGDGNSYTDSEYKTVNFNGTRMPSMWSSQVYRGDGSKRPMSDLLQHMIVMRGYGTNTDGHPGNIVKQFSPIPGAGSISGHTADQSSALVKAVQFPADYGQIFGFSSPQGGGPTALQRADISSNLLNSLLSPFTRRSSGSSVAQDGVRTRHDALLSQANDTLNGLATGRFAGVDAMMIDRSTAYTNIRKGLEDLDAAWSPLVTKYRSLITSTLRDRSTVGLNDKPVIASDDGGSGETAWSTVHRDNGMILFPVNGSDIRDWYNTANMDMAAQIFALLEFVLTRQYSNSIETGAFEANGLSGQFARNQAGAFANNNQTVGFNQQFDQHNIGHVANTFQSATFFRTFSAALNELIDVLKAQNLFAKTNFHIVTDFGRAPRASGGGSDHGFNSMCTSVITGQRTGSPLVLGNVLKEGTNGFFPANYSGSIGYMAPTTLWGVNNVMLSPTHAASSIAQLLNLENNVWINSAPPLFVLNNGNAVAKASGDLV